MFAADTYFTFDITYISHVNLHKVVDDINKDFLIIIDWLKAKKTHS